MGRIAEDSWGILFDTRLSSFPRPSRAAGKKRKPSPRKTGRRFGSSSGCRDGERPMGPARAPPLRPCPRRLTDARRRQVFWLTDRPTGRAFSSPIGPPSGPYERSATAVVRTADPTARMAFAAVVPDYSGGTAVDSHHLPSLSPNTGDQRRGNIRMSTANKGLRLRRRGGRYVAGGGLSSSNAV